VPAAAAAGVEAQGSGRQNSAGREGRSSRLRRIGTRHARPCAKLSEALSAARLELLSPVPWGTAMVPRIIRSACIVLS